MRCILRKGWRKSVAQYEQEATWIGACLVHVVSAPRIVYQRRRSIALPSDVLVCHKCDVRGCIIDKHHFLGNQKDNMKDMVKKGRHGKGGGQYKRTKKTLQKMSNSANKLWDDENYIKSQTQGARKRSKTFKMLWKTSEYREMIMKARRKGKR